MRLRACLAVFLVASCAFARADTPAVKLSVALVNAERLDRSFTISVDADRVQLPKDAEPVLPGASVDQVSIAYDRSERDFGLVRAVAPSSMVLLNTAPDEPDIYQGMPPSDDFVLLADSLSDAQWQAINGSGGLSVADLDDKQRAMFMALLPQGRLKVAPWYGTGIFYTKDQIRDLTDSLGETRIRLARTATALIMYNGKGGYPVNDIPDRDNTDRWKLASREDWGGSRDTVYGVKVRADVPNAPKNSELDYDAKSLQVAVDIDGLHTVADLVDAVAAATHVELYADARLEPKLLTVLPPKPSGDGRPAPMPDAGDILQALAFCVTGTWRQVGPAFILSDDIAGIGTRTQLWHEFERDADELRKAPLLAAGADMLKRHGPDDIGWFGSPEAWTPDEMKANRYAGKQAVYVPELDMTYSQFTPAQQALILRADQQFAHDYTWQYKHEALSPPEASTRVRLTASIQVQLLVPTIAKPVDADLNLFDAELFQTPPEAPDSSSQDVNRTSISAMAAYLKSHPDIMEKMRQKNPKLLDRILNPQPVKPVDPKALLAGIDHRALLLRAASPTEARAAVDQAGALGFNEVWLLVFESGVASVAGSTLSRAQALIGDQDALDAAIDEGRKQHVDIYACLDLLAWGAEPPKGTADFTILGETSKQAWARESIFLADHTSELDFEQGMIALDRPINAASVYVDPFSASVGGSLADLVRNVAHHSGLSGMIWRDMSPPGYGPPHPEFTTSSLPLGFNPELRLGFMRLAHVDPIDIVSPNYYNGAADVSLPMFDHEDQLMTSIVSKWLTYRFESGSAFLQHLFDIAQSAESMPILVTPRGREKCADRRVCELGRPRGHPFQSHGRRGRDRRRQRSSRCPGDAQAGVPSRHARPA